MKGPILVIVAAILAVGCEQSPTAPALQSLAEREELMSKLLSDSRTLELVALSTMPVESLTAIGYPAHRATGEHAQALLASLESSYGNLQIHGRCAPRPFSVTGLYAASGSLSAAEWPEWLVKLRQRFTRCDAASMWQKAAGCFLGGTAGSAAARTVFQAGSRVIPGVGTIILATCGVGSIMDACQPPKVD